MEMSASKACDHLDLLRNPPEFSLVLGGPLYQLLRRAHLSDDALMMVRQRIVVFVLLAWLPLLLLSTLEGHVWGSGAVVPFLFDIEVHVRFLLALPLLIVAELVVHQRMRPLLQQFLERNLIPGAAMARFEAAITSAFRLRNSVLAEVLLIVIVYGVGILIVWRHYVAEGGGEDGTEAFKLMRGASHLKFSHFDFRALGNGAFRVAGPLSNLTN